MTRDQIKTMIMAIFQQADPPLAKSFEPNYAEREMDKLIDMAEKHMEKKQMTRNQIRVMVMAILEEADADVAKLFDPETSEDPDFADEEMERLIDIVAKHIGGAGKKKRVKK